MYITASLSEDAHLIFLISFRVQCVTIEMRDDLITHGLSPESRRILKEERIFTTSLFWGLIIKKKKGNRIWMGNDRAGSS